MMYFDWIKHHAAQRADKLALVDALSETRLSYGEFDARIDELAAGWRQLGLARGERVALLARTGIDAFVVQFACARVGAIFTPLNWRLSARELCEICADAEPALLLYHDEFHEKVAEVPRVERRVIARCAAARASAAGGPAGATPASATPPTRGAAPAPLGPEDPWCILYTSGTTGKPKGVVLSYRMILANVLNFSVPTRITQDTVFLCALPTFHTGGLNVYSNPVFHAGGTVITMGDFDAETAVRILQTHPLGVTHFFGTPTHYQMMAETAAFKTGTFPTLVNCGMGGAGLTGPLIRQWLDKGVPIQPTYGMTEIGPGILTTDLHRVREKIGTSGRPSLHMELIIGDAQGRELPPGAIGEMLVRGPVVMSGYWRNAEATRQAFLGDWFKTGDLAYRDEEGFVYIVDRSKEMYISGGENVYPAEIERAILEMPGVCLCGVVGVADARWGEAGAAYVTAREGVRLDPEDIRAHCAQKLARYKLPKYIRILAEIPLTSSGKVDKNQLRAMAAAEAQKGAQ